MHRQPLIQHLNAYQPYDANEAEMLDRLRKFVEQHPDCFERSLQVGHITGSAWIINPDSTRTLLTHHAKLDRWLQPGGHADGETNVLSVALREACEETGLEEVEAQSDAIFDIDIHLIPARGAEPAHYHYDVRFLLVADPHAPLRLNRETKELAWVEILKVSELNTDASMLRMVEKTLLRSRH
jgi:8-oxo-dGTP pyrophosphatase MutT (NUDIX family)